MINPQALLKISHGQCTDAGPKAVNQDFHGILVPSGQTLHAKGAAMVVADGISSSSVSQIASESAVKCFLSDYFCTSDAWSVEHSGQQVIRSVNSWLFSQGQQSVYRYDPDKGYVCTLSAVVIKGQFAHLFHIGDSRIYLFRDGALEQLTNDHRKWHGEGQSFLSRALGIQQDPDVDYRNLALRQGDVILLTTDGVHDFITPEQVSHALAANSGDLDSAAAALVAAALQAGSDDNLTLQIVRVDQLPADVQAEIHQEADTLPLPPPLAEGESIDGFTILRTLQVSSRSHVYLALDEATQSRVVLKAPSVDQQDCQHYLERLLLEEWIARRLSSQYVVRAFEMDRPRRHLYTVTEYLEAQTLSQWLVDNPNPSLATVRDIIEQVARGLMAFHRMDMLHQDIRPENILIDAHGRVRIIDFGSVRVAGITEAGQDLNQPALLGTALYSAPEYFLGNIGTTQSDLFSLGVLAYHLLSGRFPYGTDVARCQTLAAQKRLRYRSVLSEDRAIPDWIDAALRKAVQPLPEKRYAELSEFLMDLRRPSAEFIRNHRPPLMERHPVRFWQGVSLLLGGLLLAQIIVDNGYL